MEDEGDRCPDEGYLLVRIHVPDLNVQKCLQFPRDQLIWDVKQQCLAALPKELKESFNYGLFCPPENGRAGKFLDEERRLGDYPFNGPVGYLELKYKRRVYKTNALDEKQLKSLHTRANLRRFLDYVNNGQVEKITKMCSKGLDPNFHCQDSGETPLTIATSIKKPGNVLIALVNGGALLDYRTRDGTTTMHRAVEHKSLEAMRTLLELGASPNYKDSKGLTPLYLTISQINEPIFTETLLHDHATIGAQDLQGWQEVHQACRTGLLQHLEHLLFYGADMDARNASGNTPLHVCAVNNQESCVRQLLFRGANRQALNYANQTPYQVAVIAGNMELAEIIQNYRQQDVVIYRAAPCYNPKRRSAIGWLSRAPSMNCLALPPSPCPSDRSFAPYSSASSSVSEGSNLPHGNNDNADNASIITVLALGVADKSLVDSDIISDSSGVGTANSDTTTGSISMPGTTVVCIEAYSAHGEGHISINLGDIIEVTAATDDGFLEGTVKSGKGRSGLFPANCVQEVKLRHPNVSSSMIVIRNNTNSVSNEKRVLGRRESNSKHFATAPRLKKTNENFTADPRTVVLHRGRKGFGFILRGAKATSPLMELTPSGKCPALQYLDDVDPGGVADMAGLKKGDFLLEINKEDVSSASHEHVVDLIRKSGDLVSMTVVSLGNSSVRGTLPSSKSTIIQSGNQDIPLSRQYATLPRKVGNNMGNIGKTPAPMPPRRDPKTTLSVGKARAFSILPGLEKEETEDSKRSNTGHHMSESEYTASSQPRTASIRQRPTSSRITTAELEELFERQRGGENKQTSLMTSSHFTGPNNHLANSPAKISGRVYASVAEMKRSKSRGSNKVRFSPPGDLHRDFHSTPDLVAALNANRSPSKPHRSNEDISTGTGRALPPPTHPPPPPPTGQVYKVDVRSSSEYENFKNKENCEEGIVSSFRPTAPAKFYAAPEDIKTVGYRSRSLPSHSTRTVRKSHSMRANSVFSKSGNSPPNTTSNPYAQPINKTTRSNSIAGTKKDRKKKILSPGVSVSTPPIPEPDYSCSESESGEESKKLKKFNSRLTHIQAQPIENSGNSNASGSSSGSSSIPHSLSVDEIQKGRALLKSSKSYPDDFLKKQQSVVFEDGDNSSSGVSSDQEISMPNSNQDFERVSSQDLNSMTLPHTKTQRVQTGMMTRHAVSLAQLPPPIEDTDEKEEFCLPPPPEFGENGACTVPSEAVLAPPPQFSDSRQNRVRIVGTVPKTVSTSSMPKLKQGRLHSQ